ncbi:hypothetical protein Pmani_009223 [Petrolisthes manimaculis]|uniref:Uncharacterized protein n=1 Tax=Petrolisthes manimaculis TaxID=1843537 RepID=A0AAE1UD38_9EUCA|nr:hypothetical protein Pmani_009223 [Petrolisthes manimaculis]
MITSVVNQAPYPSHSSPSQRSRIFNFTCLRTPSNQACPLPYRRSVTTSLAAHLERPLPPNLTKPTPHQDSGSHMSLNTFQRYKIQHITKGGSLIYNKVLGFNRLLCLQWGIV